MNSQMAVDQEVRPIIPGTTKNNENK